MGGTTPAPSGIGVLSPPEWTTPKGSSLPQKGAIPPEGGTTSRGDLRGTRCLSVRRAPSEAGTTAKPSVRIALTSTDYKTVVLLIILTGLRLPKVGTHRLIIYYYNNIYNKRPYIYPNIYMGRLPSYAVLSPDVVCSSPSPRPPCY